MKRSAANALGLLLWPVIAHSQSDLNWMYAAPPLDKMVGASSLIAIGVADSSWVEIVTGFEIPITVYSFRIEEILHCEPLADSIRSLTVGCPGGKDPRTGGEMWVSHAARLNPGAKELVFLQKIRWANAENYEHFSLTEGYRGVSGITSDDSVMGGIFESEPLDLVRTRIAEAAFAKSPPSLLNRADALVKAQIGPTQVVPRPDSLTRMTVTPVTVLEWLKGGGGKVISLHEEMTITKNSTWKERAYLPEAQLALIFLERLNEVWRVLDGANGLFCIGSDGSLFHHQYRGQIRYIGIQESQLRTDLQLDTTGK